MNRDLCRELSIYFIFATIISDRSTARYARFAFAESEINLVYHSVAESLAGLAR
jgi:hypothetical protein